MSARPALLALGLAVLLVGCKGVPTRSEKAARRQEQAVTAQYRPRGQKPPLPVLTPESGLSNYLAYALLNQPSVEAAYYDYMASVERITQARSFPDPQFTFQMDVQNVVTSVMPGLMGTIPWPGKLRVGAEVAAAQSQEKYFAYQAAVLESAFAVKRAYYELTLLHEKLRVNRETLGLLADLEQLARTQNEVGKATLQDVLRAQIEADRLRTEVANLEDSRHELVIQFKAALGLMPGDPAPPVPTRFEPGSPQPSAEELLDTALARNQRLKAMEAEVRGAEASVQLARKARLPDFNLGFMADVKTDPTLYRFPGNPGSMTLPIWRDKIAAQIAEAQANQHAAQARLSAEQLTLAVEFTARAHMYRELGRTLTLLNEQLLPKARQSLELARSGYLAGQIDFFNLSDSQRTLLALELEQVETVTQREEVLTELSLIIQGMTPTGGSVGAGSARTAPTPSMKKASAGGM